MPYRDPETRRVYAAAWRAANPERVRASRAQDKARNAAWRAANPERVRASRAAYYVAHPERERERNARYRAANPERVKASQAASRAAHSETVKAWQAEYRAAHREEIRAYSTTHREGNRLRMKAWCTANPERIHALWANRRARKRGAPGVTSPAEWQVILSRFGHRCAYCGKREPRLHRDHVVALATGGSNWSANLVPACRSCNSRKGSKPLAEFYAACVAAGTADLWNPELISRLNENGRKAA